MPPLKQIITVDKQIEGEGRMLLFKNKRKGIQELLYRICNHPVSPFCG